MQNKPFRFGPLALTTTTTTNLLNPGSITGGVNSGSGNLFILLKHIRIISKSGSTVNASLYLGATGANAAGTEFYFSATPVPANQFIEAYPANVRLDAADFLVGFASVATSLTIEGEGEIGLV